MIGNDATANGSGAVGISLGVPGAAVAHNHVLAAGTAAIGIRAEAARQKIRDNDIVADGDHVWGVRVVASAQRSTLGGNSVVLGGATNEEGVCFELGGAHTTSAGDVCTSMQTSNSVGFRSNTVACRAWPDCADGSLVSFSGNTYSMVGTATGVELFGFSSSWSGGSGSLAPGGQHIAFGEQQQHSVQGGVYVGGSVGAGATPKRWHMRRGPRRHQLDDDRCELLHRRFGRHLLSHRVSRARHAPHLVRRSELVRRDDR